MSKILWLSRHDPNSEQIQELNRIFNFKYELVIIDKRVDNAKEVIDLMEVNGVDDIIAVLPLELIEELIRLGVKPIRANMKFENNKFLFKHFERVMKIETEKL